MMTHPSRCAPRELRTFKRGELIHLAEGKGALWCVLKGSIRLDLQTAGDTTFACIVLPGDILGIEMLGLGHYGFTARALTPCTLSLKNPADIDPLAHMAAATNRAAEAVSLREGSAIERIQRLANMLTCQGKKPLAKKRNARPRLADIAEITCLTVETVSRTTALLGDVSGLPHQTYRQRQTLHAATHPLTHAAQRPLAA
jgi:CRP/FNR family transcriptional regulator